MLLIDADEGVTIAVNVIGEPTLPILVDAATDTDRGVGFMVR
jgi:hypothetical protein